MTPHSAIAAVNTKGALLVFPIKDQKEPPSLWSHFYPKSKMKWEWDEDSDPRVADLWHLREKLSSSGKVAYVKWFKRRATLLSLELLPAFLKILNPERSSSERSQSLSREALEVFNILKDNSPLSTKQLKSMTGLQGRLNESDYHRRLNELWDRLLIIGWGEVNDGAFPSLAIGATQHFFEEEWKASFGLSEEDAFHMVEKKLGAGSLFLAQLKKRATKIHAQQV